MLPGDRLVCAFVKPQEVGVTFTDWPLHVTVIPWFRCDVSSAALAVDCTDYLTKTSFFKVVMDGEAKLGHGKTGNWVKLPTPFTDIEPKIRAALRKHGAWFVDETTERQRPYRPHVTAQKKGRLHEGESWKCDELYIVEQKGGHKEIVAEIFFV